MELPEIVDIVFDNLYFDDLFIQRQVCVEWHKVFTDKLTILADEEWNNIISADDVVLFKYFLKRYPEDLDKVIQILYRWQRSNIPNIIRYLVMTYAGELVIGKFKNSNNDFFHLVATYDIVRELYVGMLLMTFVDREYDLMVSLLSCNVDTMKFFRYLVEIGFTEKSLVEKIGELLFFNHSGLFLFIHHDDGKFTPPEEATISKYSREYSKEEVGVLLGTFIKKTKIPFFGTLKI